MEKIIDKLVSVIVPIYKVENYLRECIDSIIYQTYTNLEIILVDDGSPDNCPAICDEYAENDNRIKVVHKENGGLSSSRNAGLEIATGEYIAFVDSDDYIDKTFIEKLYNGITENDYDLCFCKVKLLFDDRVEDMAELSLKTGLSYDKFVEHIFHCNRDKIIRCYVCRILFSNKIFKNGFRFNELIKFAEDKPFLMECLRGVNNYNVVNEYLYVYRQNSMSLCHTYRNNLIESSMTSYDATISMINDAEIRSYYSYSTIYGLLINEILRANEYNYEKIKAVKKLRIYKYYNLKNVFKSKSDLTRGIVIYISMKMHLTKILFKINKMRRKNK